VLEPAIRATIDRLAEAVAARTITQTHISEATGVHQSQVSRILSGDLKRASKNVQRLCSFYHLHISPVRVARTVEVPAAIQDAVATLLTGKKEPDAVLHDVLDSLAKWRKSIVSHD
jgi:hypothetical protein